ncbi:AEC family transporter [Arthrobacter sp. NPDC089319]|uniref:AEC family transporter n=1 Tax=Arthrobacter sp. NPDC089319 TaxID=3155915 RepID=UPI00341628FE
MQGVLLGFAVVAALILVGVAAAVALRTRSGEMQRGLGSVTYYLAGPALMFILTAEADLGAVATVYTPIALLAAAIGGMLYAVFARLALRRKLERCLVGAMASTYVNAGNIGVPIALYVVGSSAPVVSVLLAQLLVIAPGYMVLFSWCARRRDLAGDASPSPVWWPILKAVANPMTIGTGAGVAVAALGIHLPEIVWEPIRMLGEASIPLLLLAFGMSIPGQRPFRQKNVLPDVLWASIVKLAAMPVIAWALGRFAFGLDGVPLLGVTIMAALPTAQNVFLFASQFGMPVVLARDVILASAVLSLPAVLVVTLLTS